MINDRYVQGKPTIIRITKIKSGWSPHKYYNHYTITITPKLLDAIGWTPGQRVCVVADTRTKTLIVVPIVTQPPYGEKGGEESHGQSAETGPSA